MALSTSDLGKAPEPTPAEVRPQAENPPEAGQPAVDWTGQGQPAADGGPASAQPTEFTGPGFPKDTYPENPVPATDPTTLETIRPESKADLGGYSEDTADYASDGQEARMPDPSDSQPDPSVTPEQADLAPDPTANEVEHPGGDGDGVMKRGYPEAEASEDMAAMRAEAEAEAVVAPKEDYYRDNRVSPEKRSGTPGGPSQAPAFSMPPGSGPTIIRGA